MGDGPFMIGDIEVTDELLEKVEAYIQEEIEMMHKPTVLHQKTTKNKKVLAFYFMLVYYM